METDDFLRWLKEDLKGDLNEIKDHLKIMNGRIGKGEQADAAMLVRVRGLEKEIYRHPQRRRGDDGDGATWAAATVTKREGYLIGLGIAVLVAVLKVLEVVGTKLVQLMSSKP